MTYDTPVPEQHTPGPLDRERALGIRNAHGSFTPEFHALKDKLETLMLERSPKTDLRRILNDATKCAFEHTAARVAELEARVAEGEKLAEAARLHMEVCIGPRLCYVQGHREMAEALKPFEAGRGKDGGADD